MKNGTKFQGVSKSMQRFFIKHIFMNFMKTYLLYAKFQNCFWTQINNILRDKGKRQTENVPTSLLALQVNASEEAATEPR